jgi:hypothetical protein
MTTPPPTGPELENWLQGDAVLVREAMRRVLNRWQYLEALGREAVGEQTFDLYVPLAYLAMAYFGTHDLEQQDYDARLIAARRGA